MQADKTSSRPGPPVPCVAKTAASGAAIHYPFWFGGSASSLAACVTHPLDLVKVRLQMRTGDTPKTMSGTFVHILRTGGPAGLYNGISASLLRQVTYSTTRFGLYEELKARLSRPDGKQPAFAALLAASSLSGFVGGVVGNAADVLNVRMQHDAALPAGQRRNYAHAGDGLVRMWRDEGGARSFFRGVWPNSARAAAMSASQMASYDVFKALLMRRARMRDALPCHLAASFLAGVAAATVTSPVDVVKTRVMSASGRRAGTVFRVLADLYRAEGLRWMFKGWVPSFLRLGPQTIFTFIFLEGHRNVYRRVHHLE